MGKLDLIQLFFCLYLCAVDGGKASGGNRFTGTRRILQNAGGPDAVLLKFRDGLENASNSSLASWGTGDVCSWSGVDCNGNQEIVKLNITGWQLIGTLSPVLGELKSLQSLDLSDNQFHGGIPDSFGSLTNVTYVDMSRNRLTGPIFPGLSNFSKLETLDLTGNAFNGSIPDFLGTLQSLVSLRLMSNNLFGQIPLSLGNCSSLKELMLSDNFLTGEIPWQLGDLKLLEALFLASNQLSGQIPISLGNCLQLQYLFLGNNSLDGTIPQQFGNLTKLMFLTMNSNNLTGNIPGSFGNCRALKQLFLESNNLYGPIPESLGNITTLEVLSLESNTLVGVVPRSLANCQKLVHLLLSNNQFMGYPSELGNLPELRKLHLSNNYLQGRVLKLGDRSSLAELLLNNNYLVGEIPDFGFTSLSILRLDVSDNTLTGLIPESIGTLESAEFIDLSGNKLEGVIPSSMGNCKDLKTLDLSGNYLSGEIPASLGALAELKFVDVSNNKLSGPVPRSWEKVSVTISGNADLCGPPTNVTCPAESDSESKDRVWIYISLAIGVLLVGILALITAIWCTCKGKKARLTPIMEISNFSDDVVLTVQEIISATNEFSDANLLGVGTKSIVYKGVLQGGMLVAVKRLIMEHNERSAQRLNHEMQLLGKLRHPNLLKIYGFFSSEEIKALVLEFAPKGSLHQQLHGGDTCPLTWKMRLDIAVGIAGALVHLHHECIRPIIHLDIQPSNILLDENLVAKVADFGISKLVTFGQYSGDTSLSALCGTTGYIPPEYGVSTKVSTKGDVFNYGILLLELLTRKRPTFRFEGEVSLRQWVWNGSQFPEKISTVLDVSIRNELAAHEDQIVLLLRVALLCTEISPAKRPSMREVRDMLGQIESLTSPKYSKGR